MNAFIIDDERDARSTLKNFLQKYVPEVAVIAEAATVAEGIQLLSESQPDLLFLDILLPDGTGFEILDSLPELNCAIIFVTAHDKYAIKAFRYSAIDFLLKPIDPDELIQAVQRVQDHHNSEQLEARIALMIDNYSHRKFERLSLPTSEGMVFVRTENIIRCEADSNYTHIYLTEDRKATVTRTLGEYETLLPETDFFRVHQSHLINLNYMVKYVKSEGGFVEMTDHKQIGISRRRKDAFLKRIRMG